MAEPAMEIAGAIGALRLQTPAPEFAYKEALMIVFAHLPWRDRLVAALVCKVHTYAFSFPSPQLKQCLPRPVSQNCVAAVSFGVGLAHTLRVHYGMVN